MGAAHLDARFEDTVRQRSKKTRRKIRIISLCRTRFVKARVSCARDQKWITPTIHGVGKAVGELCPPMWEE